MSIPAGSTAPLYRIPEHIAYVHSEEFAKYSPTASYLANLLTGEMSVLEGSASIIWGIFEEPATVEEAIEIIAELAGQSPEDIAPEVRGFIPQLLAKSLLEETTAG